MAELSEECLAEILFVEKVVTHPAGYDLDLFGMMNIRPTDQLIWEVSWEEILDQTRCTLYKTFSSAREAAEFFVLKRKERQLGIDIEAQLCRAAGLLDNKQTNK